MLILGLWFEDCFNEAALIPGLLPDDLGPIAAWPHQWFWEGHELVNPAQEATAQAPRLANFTTTLAHEDGRLVTSGVLVEHRWPRHRAAFGKLAERLRLAGEHRGTG